MVSYERVSISSYLLQMANMPVASWKGVTNNHNQASNIRMCQPSVPSCLNIYQITKIEQNNPTLRTSFFFKVSSRAAMRRSPPPFGTVEGLHCSCFHCYQKGSEAETHEKPIGSKNILTFSHSQSSVHTTLPTEDPAAHTRQSATVMYHKTCP